MKNYFATMKNILILFYFLQWVLWAVEAVPYDYSFTSECLKTPNKPQYDGGIVVNPELKEGLKGWASFGNAKLQLRTEESGNEFVVARLRNQSFDSVSLEFFLDKEKLYTLSAWLQVSHGDAIVVATFKTPTGFHNAGLTEAKSGCWSMLKGGLTVNKSGSVQLYFQSENPTVDIWVDSVSLQPFTQEEWKSHQDHSIEKMRRSKVKIQALNREGKPQANRTLIIAQKFARFPFGCAINKNILSNQAYKNWFTSRFKYTTFENEMKWYTNEARQNQYDYSAADALLQFTRSNGVSVRGHSVFWDDPRFQPSWVPSLGPSQLAAAATSRINSIMRRYSGQVIAWDVVNENVHYNFFESKLGVTASSKFYTVARVLDRKAALFLNDYNTIEEPSDGASSPDSYLSKIRQIRAGGYNGPLSIGLEGHFRNVNLAYMRSAIDKIATAGLPIWITEVDVQSGPNQAQLLDQVLREAHAHPSVNGIVIWSAWSPQGCYRMCLTDNNFRNLPTGDVVDRIIQQFFNTVFTATTDANGFYETSLVHGDHEVSFADNDQSEKHLKSLTISQHFKCLKTPNKPQYDGGIVVNPELKEGLKGWASFGNAKLQLRTEESGNEFVVARLRNQSFDSVSQEFFLDKEKLYTLSAWLQVSHGDAIVVATFKTPTGFHNAGSTEAKSGCWSMLKGGLTVNKSGSVQLYFQSENPTVDIWVDSVSLQPFTQEEWKSHQDHSIEKMRRSKVKIQALNREGKPQANRTLIIAQKFARFPFGCAINKNILSNQAYKNWFTSRFKYTTFENEMKWYTNEARQNQYDYSAADALLQFTRSNGVSVRGHSVFWDDPRFQPSWVPSLGPSQLAAAATSRINSIMRRYSGQVIAWDVVNENVHYNFFESKLGVTASSKFYTVARVLDRKAALFLNDYNTIEEPSDGASSPDSYLSKIRQIRAGGYNGPLSIGLEGHFRNVNLAYMRSAIDKIATAGLPIWITEVDVQSGPNQAQLLDQVLREAHAHPSVNGIVIWSAWSPQGCYRMCLTDNNFRNLPTGDVVDRIIQQFFNTVFTATTDANGFYETSLVHGDYEVSFADNDQSEKHLKSLTISQHFKVEASKDIKHVKILA
ncbi:hypothetical protein SSX86_025801 [Deinandra increscens subsp. villosa]|uniref:GH10 domain-containing protein n=1 Tax=Deinandra increscens subsp. villosa TaxID=3103831 RepID=A0AAP0CIG5_9ASTR